MARGVALAIVAIVEGKLAETLRSKSSAVPLVGCSKLCEWLQATASFALTTRRLTSGAGRSQLSYQVESFDYGERLVSAVDVELSIAAETRKAALLICSAGAQADRGDDAMQR